MNGLLRLGFNCRKETYSVALGKTMVYAGRERNSILRHLGNHSGFLCFPLKDSIVGFEEIFLENSDPSVCLFFSEASNHCFLLASLSSMLACVLEQILPKVSTHWAGLCFL